MVITNPGLFSPLYRPGDNFPPQDHLLGKVSYLGSASFQARGRKQGGRTPSMPLSRNRTTLFSLRWLELSPWSSLR